MKRYLTGLFIDLFLFSACSSSNKNLEKYSNQNDFCPKITQKIVDECTNKGGVLNKQGKAQCYMCTIKYSGGGKVCTSSKQCQGECSNYGIFYSINRRLKATCK